MISSRNSLGALLIGIITRYLSHLIKFPTKPKTNSYIYRPKPFYISALQSKHTFSRATMPHLTQPSESLQCQTIPAPQL